MDGDDVPVSSSLAAAAAAVATTAPTALSRSVSQQSTTSAKSHRSIRGATGRRGSSRVRPGLSAAAGLANSTTSSSSIASDDNKSLTSFPSFSPKVPSSSPPLPVMPATTAAMTATSASRPRLAPASSNTSLVDSLTVDRAAEVTPTTATAARNALFDDSPTLHHNSRVLPGALHLTDDAHLARLIGKHGAVALVRQLAEDLAVRDAQVVALRARAADRERFLRKIILDCGLSSLDLATRLRAMEQQEQEAREARALEKNGDDSTATQRPSLPHGVSDMMSDAMAENSLGLYEDGLDSFVPYNESTIRASSTGQRTTSNGSTETSTTGTTKGWKEYFWGGGGRKNSSRASSIAGSDLQSSSQPSATVVRARVPPGTERRSVLSEDVFHPPQAEGELGGTQSRASSVSSAPLPGRKTSLASMALRLVGGGGGGGSGSGSNSISEGMLTVPKVTNKMANGSAAAAAGKKGPATRMARAASTQGAGPKALMTMRRTPSALSVRSTASSSKNGSGAMTMRRQIPERWGDMSEATPGSAGAGPGGSGGDGPNRADSESYGPVEMDTILPLEVQPPTLTHMYRRYNTGGYLIDRFGFIYDQRRKRRQREAAQMARRIKRGSRHSETLGVARSGRATPSLLEEEGEDKDEGEEVEEVATGRSSPAVSAEEAREVDGKDGKDGKEVPAKRWQDYLKIATFPTELLSHTPAMSDDRIEVITDDDGIEGGSDSVAAAPKSPGIITADGRGFVPSTAATTTTTTTMTTTTTGLDTDSIGSGTTGGSGSGSSGTGLQTAVMSKGTATTNDDEPVRLLLQQLSELHDKLQKERTVRWNEFLRKVRAERRREGEVAAATAAAAAEARYLRATAVMPETRLADGEIVGVAGLGNKGKLGRAKWNEFRMLVLGGIPVALRAKVWAECTGATSLRVPGEYGALVAQSEEADEVEMAADEDVRSQIQADIHRTLTDNIFFRGGPGALKLREVLLAYARRHPAVGYCQGMNLIAANLLLVTPSAEDAFWLLASIVETILPAGYYGHELATSRADQQVLRGYVAALLPRLSGHFDALSIDLETMTFPWFLSVFTDCLSAEALFRVWDVVFCLGDGSAFLFSVALALLKLNEAALLRCESAAAVYTYINHQMTNHAISIDGLVQASEALRRLVRRDDVEARRAQAMEAERVRAEARVEARAKAKARAERRRGGGGGGGGGGEQIEGRGGGLEGQGQGGQGHTGHTDHTGQTASQGQADDRTMAG